VPVARPSATALATSAPPPPVGNEAADSRRHRDPGRRTPVIWLGLDALDFELVDRLAAEGRMPNWKRLESEGYTARLKSYAPILSPILWTTLATGVGPDIHGVLDFQQVDPKTGDKVPISGNSRKLPAIWNVASASGLTVGVVGWWATHPAEEVNGFFVTDHASPILFEGLPKQGVAYPAALAGGIEQVAARDGAVTSEELAGFVATPVAEIAAARASAGGLPNDLVLLSRAIAATRVQSRIGLELYDRYLPDLMMLYLEGTDVVGHLYASEIPPRMSCVSDEDFARHHGTVDAYYALVDGVLGQWMRRAEEDGATLIVNSDHGFKWGNDRSCERGSLNPETAGFWHRLEGVFAAWGARVQKSSRRGQATVFDVEPTVAALLGLPVDRHSSGVPVRSAFPGLTAPRRADLAASIPVRRLAAEPTSPKESSEYAQKLRALGYLSGGESERATPSGADRPGLTEVAWNNLGVYLSTLGGAENLRGAERAYEKSLAMWPRYPSALFNFAVLHRIRGDDRAAIDGLFRSLEAGQPDPERAILDWALYYNATSKSARELEVLERGAGKYPESEAIQRALGMRLFQGRNCPRADATLARFETTTRNPQTLNALALVKACLGRKEEAIAFFRRSLDLDPNQTTVARSLGVLEGESRARRQEPQGTSPSPR